MAITCATLTGSRKLPCKASVAGIRSIAFGVFDPMDRIVTTTAGVVTISGVYATSSLARFDVKNTTAKYLENATKGADTNSKSIKGAVSLHLTVPPDTADHIAVAKIADTLMDRQWVVFLELKDGTILCAGSQNGADVLTADADTGGTANDMNGFTVNITTDEIDFARKYALSGAGITEYASALMATV